MRNDPCARRVILVVLDGVRPDAITRFALPQLGRCIADGASTLDATTVSPSVTTAVMTSLMTGVSPKVHGLASDSVFIPKSRKNLVPIPECLARAGLPSTAFMTEVAPLFRGIAARIGRRLGLSGLHLVGKNAAGVLAHATPTLCSQRRGLILLHWPDADHAGHEYGWMTPQYAEACRQLDTCLRMLMNLVSDPETLVMALADHGGGGAKLKGHESDHPADRTIPIVLSGAGVASTTLQATTLLDVPPTILHALGLEIPAWFEGRVLHEAFIAREAPEPAVA